MAGVNGVEIKVGQVWRTRGGEVVTVDLHDSADSAYPWRTTTGDWGEIWVTNSGREYPSRESSDDLIELVKDEKGFTIWHGGEQPVPDDTKVTCLFKDGTSSTWAAHLYKWSDTNLIAYKGVEEAAQADRTLGWTSDGKKVEYRYERGPGCYDIYAHKVVEEAAQADSATLAEETLSALGWTFDGQAWVEQPKIDMVPNALDVQVGGTHYKDCAIQPIEYIHANKLGFAEGNVVKYITRHRQKHGADDVRKVIHYCQLLLELEYGAGKTEGGA